MGMRALSNVLLKLCNYEAKCEMLQRHSVKYLSKYSVSKFFLFNNLQMIMLNVQVSLCKYDSLQ